MSCSDCHEAQALDGIVPPCQAAGCWIPKLNPMAARAVEIHDRLQRLSRLNIGGEVLRIYNAGKFDLELLATAEDALRVEQPEAEE